MESVRVAKASAVGPSETMQEFRCKQCNKMLATIKDLPMAEHPTVLLCKPEYEEQAVKLINSLFDIKCPRCKTLNEIMV